METTVLADTTNTIDSNAAKKKVTETKAESTRKNNRIQVSSNKKPLYFYLNLAKRYFKQHKEVELSALGKAIPIAVQIAEILKSNGLAIQKKVLTSTVAPKDEARGRWAQKAKIEIVLERTEKAEKETAAAATEPEVAAEEPNVSAEELAAAAERLKNLSIKEGSAELQ